MKQSPLIPLVIMLAGCALGFVYANGLDPQAVVPPIPAAFELASLRGLDTLHIDYSVLANEQFKSLRVFGQLPVQPQSGGNSDPFQ